MKLGRKRGWGYGVGRNIKRFDSGIWRKEMYRKEGKERVRRKKRKGRSA